MKAFRNACLFEAALALPALIWSLFFGLPLFADWQFDGKAIALGIAASLPMLAGFVLLTRSKWPPLEAIRQALDQFVTQFFARTPLWGLLLVSCLAGLAEEWLFRGALQKWFSLHVHPALAIAIAGALFGLCHLVTWTYGVIAAVIGVYLGWLYYSTGNLAVPIVTHAFYDFVALWALRSTTLCCTLPSWTRSSASEKTT